MKNLYPQNVKAIKAALILFFSTFTAFAQAQAASPQKKNKITEDTLYQKLDEFNLTGKMPELLEEVRVAGKMYWRDSRCGCALPPRDLYYYNLNTIDPPKLLTSKAYPNPAVSNTELQIELTEDAFVEISLLNINGQLIQSVFSGNLLKGRHNYPIEMLKLPAGMYFFQIHSGKLSETVKVIKI